MTLFKNRNDAGKKLAEKISNTLKDKDAIVLAIPRGGVIIGKEISDKIGCPMDVIISKKITPPSSPEYAIGAITHDGTIYQSQNWDMFSNEPNFEGEVNKKRQEVARRLEEYRGSSNYNFDNKTVILVDDGIATGATVIVLLKWLSNQNISKLILAIPVIPPDTLNKIKPLVDSVIALDIPNEFSSVGQFYDEFQQVSDEEVMTILSKNKIIGVSNGSHW